MTFRLSTAKRGIEFWFFLRRKLENIITKLHQETPLGTEIQEEGEEKLVRFLFWSNVLREHFLVLTCEKDYFDDTDLWQLIKDYRLAIFAYKHSINPCLTLRLLNKWLPCFFSVHYNRQITRVCCGFSFKNVPVQRLSLVIRFSLLLGYVLCNLVFKTSYDFGGDIIYFGAEWQVNVEYMICFGVIYFTENNVRF